MITFDGVAIRPQVDITVSCPRQCPRRGRARPLFLLIAVTITLAAATSARAQSVIHVDSSATGLNDGTTWTNAFDDLQDALAAAVSGEAIWVAAGVYTPAPPGGNQRLSFRLVDGVAVFGGFPPGGGDGTFGARNPDAETNGTVLSGDLDGDDGPDFSNRSGNALHVVTSGDGPGQGVSATLDGFTVRGGHGVGTEGGGLFIPSGGSCTLRNLVVTGNWADKGGGGARLAGNHRVSNVLFSANKAIVRGGGADCSLGVVFVDCDFIGNTTDLSGGAVALSGGSAIGSPRFVNVRFAGNTAGWRGGAAFGNDSACPAFTNCVFSRNSAALFGGALASLGGAPACHNVTFFGNTAGDQGGALFAETHGCSSPPNSYLTIANSIFANNAAPNGGGAAHSTQQKVAQFDHCLFWNNGPRPFFGSFTSGNPVFDDGSGAADPRFIHPPGADGIPGTRDDDLRVRPGSPAVDAGDSALLPADIHDIDGDANTTEPLPRDADGAPRVHGGVVDIGAFENSASTWFVDPLAGGANAGSSWTDAATDLQAVLAAAQSGDEIRVAAGTYRPTAGSDRTIAFQLVDGVALIGGFPAGGGDGSFLARDPDPVTNGTILSGDIGAGGVATDNSFHVLRADGIGPGTLLDGFAIADGNATGAGNDASGGGILVENGARPVLRRLHFSGNNAAADGGAMAVIASGPSASFCSFAGNTAARGGALFVDGASTPHLASIAFFGNAASASGGAVFNEASAPLALANALFSANAASSQGGGVFHAGAGLSLVQATFRANTAAAGQGGAIHSGAGSVVLANSILRENTPQHTGGFPLDSASASNLTGDGSPATDPQFNDPDGPDGVPGTVDDDLGFAATSIAFNAGDAALLPGDGGDLDGDGDLFEALPLDLAGNPRDSSGSPDQGAVEVPDTPTFARDDLVTFAEDPAAPVVIDVLADNGFGPDADADSTIDPSTTTAVAAATGNGPLFGTLINRGDGTFLYTPEKEFNGTDSFRYYVRDAYGVPSNTATVTINVTAVNDPPSFDGGPGFRFASAGGSPTVAPGWATNMEPGGGDDETAQVLSFVTTVVDTTGTLGFVSAPAVAADGTLSFTLAAGTSGLAVVKVELTDGGGGADTSAAKWFTIGAGGPFVFYADADAGGNGASTSWTDAQPDFAAALMLAMAGDEIWVAEGVYKPASTGDRSLSFVLGDGVRVYGGFTGGETARTQRNPDPATNNTILSGNIGLPGSPSDNSFHVLSTSGTLPGTVIDGFTITAGNASSSATGHADGGGILCLHQNALQIANVIISDCNAFRGGGFAARSAGGAALGVPLLTNVTFSNNTANWLGGGIYHYFNGRIDLDDVNFDGNHAGNAGGAIYAGPALNGELALSDANFTDNSTGGDGGAIHSGHGTSTTVDGALFEGNTAGNAGGAVYAPDIAVSVGLESVSFSQNAARDGGGAFLDRDATLSAVAFVRNAATSRGGGLFTAHPSTLSGVTFSGNTAGQSGGGIYNADLAAIANAVFSGNSAAEGGGLWSARGAVANAAFAGNTAFAGNGGAIYHPHFGGTHPFPRLALGNVTIAANGAAAQGGGLFAENPSAPLLTNSILSGNTAGNGWPSQIEGGALDLSSSNNLVEGGHPAFPGFIEDNPLFLRNPGPGDGDWSTLGDNDYGDLHLYAVSPAIDAGNSGLLLPDATDLDGDGDTAEPLPFDLDGNPRITGAVVNLGVFEGAGAPVPPSTTFAGLFPGLDPQGDDNADGLTNYHNYAAGFDAAAAFDRGASHYPFGANEDAFYRFIERANADDVFTRYEWSLDLVQWFPAVPGVDYLVDEESRIAIDREEITLKLLYDPLTQPLLFWRTIYSTSP